MRRSTSSARRPAHHANSTASSFTNPWPSAGKATYSELFASSFFPLGWYGEPLHKHDRAREIEVVEPDWGTAALNEKGLRLEDSIIGTWLGHAGAMVRIPLAGIGKKGADKDSLWLLFDPIFSSRAGPTQYTGPQRINKSPCQVTDLPKCDAVLISHNHYDHLDLSTIKDIHKKFPRAKFFVALNNKSWLSQTGVPDDQIHEMDWWQQENFSPKDFGYHVASGSSTRAQLRFSCLPAQHNSGRGVLDQGNTLWCGWAVEHFLHSQDKDAKGTPKRKGSVYHAGDTGYRRTAKSVDVCPVFSEIGQKFGGFDLAFVPIWRGGSLGFVSSLGLRLSHKDLPATFHASPEDAIEIHKDVKSRNSIGVHFGTFIGSANESFEAVIEYDQAREEAGVSSLEDAEVGKHGRAGVIDIGGSLAVKIES